MRNMIWEDFAFFLARLTNLPVSKTLKLGDSGFCVSTNCDYENWVYFPSDITSPRTAKMAAEFFRERGEAFMWPVYSSGREVLESSGLIYAGDLTAMTLDPKISLASRIVNDVKFSPVISREDSELWARTAWHSFGGGTDDTPANYYALVEALNGEQAFSLFTAELDGEAAGTFLVTSESSLMGVYYFGVISEVRRRGVARAMMNEVCRLSGGKRIVLQATPVGREFYRAFGFEELFRIPVYSTESNIF